MLLFLTDGDGAVDFHNCVLTRYYTNTLELRLQARFVAA
jgi:hypothetical protein